MGCGWLQIGGSFGHAVFEEYRPPAPVPRVVQIKQEQIAYHILPLSAHSKAHLQRYSAVMAEFFSDASQAAPSATLLRDSCGTMACHRSRFAAARKCFVVTSTTELAKQLTTFSSANDVPKPSAKGAKARVAFVFTGQGSQWAKMGVDLMVFPAYRSAVQKVDIYFKRLARWSLLDKITSLTTEEMTAVKYAQPLTFLVQVGLIELLKSFHVVPDVVVGHSAGEVASNYASGLLTLEDSVKVIYYRSMEQEKLEGSGRMLAVALGVDAIMPYIKDMPEVEIACINSPESTVLASSENVLKDVSEKLPEGVRKTFIPGGIAFHSSRTEPILESMRSQLSFLNGMPQSWSIPCVSTATGTLSRVTDATYWCDNIRQTVRFQAALEYIFADEDEAPEIVVELGPHRTLVSPILQTLSAIQRQAMVIPTLKRDQPGPKQLLEVLGQLYEKGIQVAFDVLAKQEGYEFLETLPKHPFLCKPLTTTPEYLRRDLLIGVYSAGPTAGAVSMINSIYMILPRFIVNAIRVCFVRNW